MNNKKPQIFFGVALAIVFVLSALVLLPFLTTLVLAVILSVLLNPIFKRVTKLFFKNKTIGALMTIILSCILIFIPIGLLSYQLFLEAQSAYSSFGASGASNIVTLNQSINENLRSMIPSIDVHLEKYIGDLYTWLISNLGNLFSGTFDIFLKTLIILVSMFFLLKDGEFIQKNIKDMIPISSDVYDYLVKSMKVTINSVVFGSIAIAIIQGVSSGIGFAIFGIPNSTMWGTVAAAASFIPGFGTGILFVPMMLYAFLYGSLFQVFGLLLWAMIFVNAIETFLRPMIIHKSVNIHPLFIIFSILGGISFFGPVGSILGPLILGLLFAMIRVYKMKDISIAK
ncbi:MAG: AI-2E family transporter [bacterium]